MICSMSPWSEAIWSPVVRKVSDSLPHSNLFYRRIYGAKTYPFSLLEPSVLYFIIHSILGHYENNLWTSGIIS